MFHNKLVVIFIALMVIHKTSASYIENRDISEKKLANVYKILQTFLELQLDELERSFVEDMEFKASSNKKRMLKEMSQKRALKKQGFMDRMRHKMDHDISIYGWDKKK